MMDAKRTVVIIEDEPDAAERIARLLEAEGMVVHVADGGRRGIKLIREHRPALVITDLHMPEMNGLEVLLAIRGDEALKTTPVMIVTADRSHDMRQDCLRLGARSYLFKPFDGDELVGNVRVTLRA